MQIANNILIHIKVTCEAFFLGKLQMTIVMLYSPNVAGCHFTSSKDGPWSLWTGIVVFQIKNLNKKGWSIDHVG